MRLGYDADMQSPPLQRIDALLRDARAQIDSVDAAWLLAHAVGRHRGWLYAHADDLVDAGTAERFATLVQRRRDGEPVAYLTGRRGFWTFELQVTEATLIPRPETELLVELALDRLPVDRSVRIADLGTGSGAIALALASERPRADVLATDASADALAVAAGNALALQVRNVRFQRGDWCTALGAERFDLIASNPPYISADDPHLRQGDLRHEPADALASGVDGLDAIRRIVAAAPMHLVDGGWLLLEHGMDQADDVRALLEVAGLVDVRTARDLEGRDRVTLGCRPSS
jgi:release factor glutamine methyltransferase